MRANSLVYLLLLVCGANCCSLIPNIPYYTVTQRTILAPLVVYGRVLNTTATYKNYFKYKACIQVLEVIKGDKNLPKEICLGYFGSDELCLTHVIRFVDYIFYMTSDMKANYKDGQPKSSAELASNHSLAMAKRGVCDPFLSQASPCRRPIISRDRKKFKSIVRVQEEKTAELVCHATGTSPLVVIWSKRGDSGFQHNVPHSSNTLRLPRVSMSDMGVYECTIWNPAGKTTAIVRLFIDPVPCGTFMYLKPGEQEQIQSPHYPQSYRKDKLCSWRICPSPGKRVKLDFKEFNLRPINNDNLQILHECTPVRSTVKNCGSFNPGVLVSQCASRCIQVWFQSDNFKTIGSSNKEFRFHAVASATDEATALFDFKTLYCSHDLLIKFVPKDINYKRMIGRVVHSFKNPRAGKDLTITFESFAKQGLFGCRRKVLLNKEYYVGATRSSNGFIMNFAMATDARNLPKKFDIELNKVKAAPPNCRPRGKPRPPRKDG